jgi:hypothetical protein
MSAGIKICTLQLKLGVIKKLLILIFTASLLILILAFSMGLGTITVHDRWLLDPVISEL